MGALALPLLVAAELARQSLGPDALALIDNLARHEAPPPRAAPAIVRELLARPLEAADATALFRRFVPSILSRVDEEPKESLSFDALLERYVEQLAAAQRMLRTATGSLEAASVLRRLDEGLLSADQLLAIAEALDARGIERANALFLEATLQFVRELRRISPGEPRQLQTAIGTVVIGSRANDRHGAGAVLIIDAGGDDVYERAPAVAGAISVLIDLAGDDRYLGSDLAVGALSALVDMSGNDRYESRGPGLGAAIAGAALLVDLAGDDRYESRFFGQGAAAFGLGVLVDLEGDDDYRLQAWGQGFGLAGGVGLVWDRGGDDRYTAQGAADPFGRGRLSGAQGAAFGYRTLLGGGIGILRDERGDDRYEAQMFAQGSGYYYGVGLLWDGEGDDRYDALRYAQGNGAHEALGVLRDDGGDDGYELAYGVGQGMGLDLALGVLVDAAGEDRYAARFLAQGTATANGLGLLADGGGADRLRVEDRSAWGSAEPLRGLPSVGLLLHDASKASFEKVQSPQNTQAQVRCEPAKAPELANLRPENFDALYVAGEALRCALERGEMWDQAESLLARDAAHPLAHWIAAALPSAPQARREAIRAALAQHPRCSVRAAALSAAQAQAALASSCWQLQAAALRLGAKPGPGTSLPSFLRGSRAY